MNEDGLTDVYVRPEEQFVPVSVGGIFVPLVVRESETEAILIQQPSGGEFELGSALAGTSVSALSSILNGLSPLAVWTLMNARAQSFSDSSLGYCVVPAIYEPLGLCGESDYNSNGFARGLVNAISGFPLDTSSAPSAHFPFLNIHSPSLSGLRFPGFEKPVPVSEF